MRAFKAALTSTAIVVAVLASGTVLAQSELVKRPPNSEIGAARQALDDAMAHLRKVRDPQNRENVRAMTFIKLAQQQLDAEGSLYPVN